MNKETQKKKNATILVVDDQMENVQLMADVLSSNGYVTLTASGGAEALEILKSKKPDAILLDMLMPGMDGFEVIRRVRQNADTSNIPIMVITAMLVSDDDRRRIEREAQGIFLKGTFWIEDLLKEVGRLVNLSPRRP